MGVGCDMQCSTSLDGKLTLLIYLLRHYWSVHVAVTPMSAAHPQGLKDFSLTCTSWPWCLRPTPAESPAMPAPTIKILRDVFSPGWWYPLTAAEDAEMVSAIESEVVGWFWDWVQDQVTR